MLIYPAIDIINGKVVRLTKGDYGKVKEYSLTPVQAGQSFVNDGANYMHVVDLDGAKSGKADNYENIGQVVKATGLFVEVGGGIRNEEIIEKYISSGVSRVILGTVAVKNFNFVKEMAKKYPSKIAVGVDELDGKIAINGWKEITDVDAFDFCEKLYDNGVSNVIFTDISKDGAMSGTNIKAYERLSKINGLKITASGGISSLEEIKVLSQMGLYGAILGKALYENKISLKEAISVAKEK